MAQSHGKAIRSTIRTETAMGESVERACAGIGSGKPNKMRDFREIQNIFAVKCNQAPNVLEHGGGPKPYRREDFDAV